MNNSKRKWRKREEYLRLYLGFVNSMAAQGFFDDPTVNYRNILFNTEVRKQISLTLRFQKCEVGM